MDTTNLDFVQENATMHHFSDTVFVLDQQTIFVSDSDEETEQNQQTQQLGLDSPISMDDIKDDELNELNELEQELEKAKHELNDIVDSHNDQMDDFQSMIDKVQIQSESIGIIKEKQKQRSSIQQIETNYQNELQQSHDTHIKELQKLKKYCAKLKLNAKIQDAKIKELTKENNEMTEILSKIKNTQNIEMENARKEYNERIEQEINKRISQMAQLKQQKNAEIDILNKRLQQDTAIAISNDNLNENEQNELINSLKEEIQRLEKKYTEEQDMFFKHSEIFDFKLEREAKEKKRMEKKLLAQKIEYETEIKEINAKVIQLKQEFSEQTEINIHLQNSLENAIEKDMESYDEIAEMLRDLQNKNKEKEQELDKVKQFMKVKESENKTLRVSVNANHKTINELETMLSGLKSNENKFENKKKEIVELNQKINVQKRKSLKMTINNEFDLQIIDVTSNKSNKSNDEMESTNDITNIGKPILNYSASHTSHNVDNEIRSKYSQEMESIKIQYNKLINQMKKEYQTLENKWKEMENELNNSQRLLQETEDSKLFVLTNFTVEIDRMRNEIKKQHLLCN